MSFNNVKQKVVQVFHHQKETAIDIKNKPLKTNRLSGQKAGQARLHRGNQIQDIVRLKPRSAKQVKMVDGITARVRM